MHTECDHSVRNFSNSLSTCVLIYVLICIDMTLSQDAHARSNGVRTCSVESEIP